MPNSAEPPNDTHSHTHTHRQVHTVPFSFSLSLRNWNLQQSSLTPLQSRGSFLPLSFFEHKAKDLWTQRKRESERDVSYYKQASYSITWTWFHQGKSWQYIKEVVSKLWCLQTLAKVMLPHIDIAGKTRKDMLFTHVSFNGNIPAYIDGWRRISCCFLARKHKMIKKPNFTILAELQKGWQPPQYFPRVEVCRKKEKRGKK